mmetsp:Transcript_13691/g.34962  ORF Transcript_13691/g.34962 Transcript_13691/m.34962 type:complete len:127 (-) Transcript_13691:418-798(-)
MPPACLLCAPVAALRSPSNISGVGGRRGGPSGEPLSAAVDAPPSVASASPAVEMLSRAAPARVLARCCTLHVGSTIGGVCSRRGACPPSSNMSGVAQGRLLRTWRSWAAGHRFVRFTEHVRRRAEW